MSEQLREALSAIVDGEASEFELRRVLDEMGKDDSLVRAWQSYHLIRQSAQGENVQGVAALGERIWAALDTEEFLQQEIVQEEPMTAAVAPPMRRPWGLIGSAVAAALALGVFVASNLDSDPSAQMQPQVVQAGTIATQSPQAAQSVFDATLREPSKIQSGVQTVSALPVSRESFANQQGVSQQISTARSDRLATTAIDRFSADDDFDYGPGFVPYSALSDADRARTEGYFLHHVQHQAVNNDNVLSFVKMISYPQ